MLTLSDLTDLKTHQRILAISAILWRNNNWPMANKSCPEIGSPKPKVNKAIVLIVPICSSMQKVSGYWTNGHWSVPSWLAAYNFVSIRKVVTISDFGVLGRQWNSFTHCIHKPYMYMIAFDLYWAVCAESSFIMSNPNAIKSHLHQNGLRTFFLTWKESCHFGHNKPAVAAEVGCKGGCRMCCPRTQARWAPAVAAAMRHHPETLTFPLFKSASARDGHPDAATQANGIINFMMLCLHHFYDWDSFVLLQHSGGT